MVKKIMKRLLMLFYNGKVLQVRETDGEIIVSIHRADTRVFSKNTYGLDDLEIMVRKLECKK